MGWLSQKDKFCSCLKDDISCLHPCQKSYRNMENIDICISTPMIDNCIKDITLLIPFRSSVNLVSPKNCLTQAPISNESRQVHYFIILYTTTAGRIDVINILLIDELGWTAQRCSGFLLCQWAATSGWPVTQVNQSICTPGITDPSIHLERHEYYR